MQKNFYKIWFGALLLFVGDVDECLTQIPFYGNEWINYSQKYYKIPVAQEGIYRISYNTIQASYGSIPNPKSFRLFWRGQEIAIHVEGESDNVFNTSDYIEFYGQKNDGWLDQYLYESTEKQTNPYYSCFTDTSYYYLTSSASFNNLRLITDNNTSFPATPIPYFWRQEHQTFSDVYQQGINYGSRFYPGYDIGEGWMKYWFSQGAPLNISFPTEHVFNSPSLNAVFETDIYATNDDQHALRLRYGSLSTLILDTVFYGYQRLKYTQSLNPSSLSTSTTFSYDLYNNTYGTQYTSISYARLKYPHTSELEGQTTYNFSIPYNGISPSYLRLYNYGGSAAHYVYDLSDNRRIKVVQSADTLKMLIPASNLGQEKRFFLSSVDQIQYITTLGSVGQSGFFTNYSAVNKDSAYLIISHPSLWTGVQEYADYRESSGFQVELANVEELYDQFAYGVKKHPLSIKNFVRYAWNNWPSRPSNVFLIGKSIMESGQLFRKDPDVFSRHLLPAHGYPVSDNMFCIDVTAASKIPYLQVGRLAATSSSQVMDYLSKVQEFDQAINHSFLNAEISEKQWLKRIIHFGGGGDTVEQKGFATYLNTYRDTIKEPFFGGKVYNFFKNSAAPFTFNVADSIKNLVNNGVIMMSFFGHSSANSFDISIDNASSYDNQGKYFFLLSNGCLSGDIFQNNETSFSEDYVLTPSRGAVAFIAQNSYAYPQDLHEYSLDFYRSISKTRYNSSIGEIMQNTAEVTMQNSAQDFSSLYTAAHFQLHGDPALAFSKNQHPDYAVIEPSQMSFEPANVTTDLDSFELHLKVNNIAKAVDSLVSLDVRRIFPDGSDTSYTMVLPPIYYQHSLVLKLPVMGSSAAGLNRFEVRVDPTQLIPEESEWNNDILMNNELYISSEEATPIYPYDYAVIGNPSLTLKASTNEVFAPTRTYVFQLDTSDTYASPLKKDTLITQSGGVLSWPISLPLLADSTVYFWRVSPWNINPDDLKWKEHSFQYIPNQEGWGQDHFHQFKNNAFSSLNYLKNEWALSFDTTGASITCQTMGDPDLIQLYGVKYEWNNTLMYQNLCEWEPAINVVVFDPLNLKPWYNAHVISGDTFNYPAFDFGNANNMLESSNCFSGRKQALFSFQVYSVEQMDSLTRMLEDKIPTGHYILAYSAGPVNFSSLASLNGSGVKAAFQNLGSQEITSLGDKKPWIFFVKKGDVSTMEEKTSASSTDYISLTGNMKGPGNYGEMSGPVIGPAMQWGSLHWNYTLQEGTSDSVWVDVLDLNDNILFSTQAWNGSVIPLENTISSTNNPYIKLRARLKDGTFNTPSFSSSWHVLYQQAPESALNEHLGSLVYNDTLDQGDRFSFSIPITNVSTKDMDSLRVQYTWTHVSTQQSYSDEVLLDSLRINQTLKDTISIATNTLKTGDYVFKMEVNPKDSLWQKEQYHFNNSALYRWHLKGDQKNPLLDVTFDGIHILNGEIVSPKPEIYISLRDENKFLILNEEKDTAQFIMTLTWPSGQSKRVYFSNNQDFVLDYKLSAGPNKPFEIKIKPLGLSDGLYSLKVNGNDKSGNTAGPVDYQISFEVVNQSSITHVMNYPNPFSTSTRFVFTLTGSVIPDVFKIQILSVSGKIVREITQDELGPLRIGRNITSYAWDGTDEYGDALGNGVYFYRVLVKSSNQEIEHRQTSVDQYFTKGFGKMYLMR